MGPDVCRADILWHTEIPEGQYFNSPSYTLEEGKTYDMQELLDSVLSPLGRRVYNQYKDFNPDGTLPANWTSVIFGAYPTYIFDNILAWPSFCGLRYQSEVGKGTVGKGASSKCSGVDGLAFYSGMVPSSDGITLAWDDPRVKVVSVLAFNYVKSGEAAENGDSWLEQARMVKERCGNMISEEEKKEIMGHIATATIGSGAAAAGGLAAGITGIVGAVKASKAEKEATDDRSKAAAMKSAAKVASIGGMVGGGVATIGGGLGVGFGASVWTKLKDIMPKIEDCQRAVRYLDVGS